MLLHTLRYQTDTGWLEALPTSLNSPSTLVLAFGASEYADDPSAFAELARSLPDAVLLGCSTSGEIAGTQVHDAQDSWAAGARLAQQLPAARTA